MGFLAQLYGYANSLTLSLALPFLAQQNGERLNTYERIAQSFRKGPNSRPIYIGAIVLVITLIVIYWTLRMYTDILAKTDGEKKNVSILDAVKNNIKLNNKQERYLLALIEKFQDKHPYDPEIKTEYLEQFLFFILQSLTHAPDRAIRRKTHYVPTFGENEILEVMFKTGDTSFTTEKCEIGEQDNDNVVIKKPSDVAPNQLREGREISTAYHKGDLTLRGNAEIRHIMDDKLLLEFPEGMHFEEHRTYDRVEMDHLPCQLILQEFEGEAMHIEGTIQDLSIGGALVKVHHLEDRIHENIRGHLQFELKDRELDLQATVAHLEVDEENETMELGMQFIEQGLANRQYLHDFIEEKKADEK